MAHIGSKVKPLLVTVVTAGVRVPLSATTLFTPGATVKAKLGNTLLVYLADDTVDSSLGTELSPGAGVEITGEDIRGTDQEIDLSEIYIDADTDGNAVTVLYLARKK